MATASGLLDKRGGGGVFTGSLATGPPSPIYAKHTTINGSRPGFIVVVVLSGLVFFAILLGGAYWYYRMRKRSRQRGISNNKSNNTRRSMTLGRKSGMYGRAAAASLSNSTSGKWTTLEDMDHDDDDEEAFSMPMSTSISMMDLNHDSKNHQWNPVYSASGESLHLSPAAAAK